MALDTEGGEWGRERGGWKVERAGLRVEGGVRREERTGGAEVEAERSGVKRAVVERGGVDRSGSVRARNLYLAIAECPAFPYEPDVLLSCYMFYDPESTPYPELRVRCLCSVARPICVRRSGFFI